jgi:hypothetical protein
MENTDSSTELESCGPEEACTGYLRYGWRRLMKVGDLIKNRAGEPRLIIDIQEFKAKYSRTTVIEVLAGSGSLQRYSLRYLEEFWNLDSTPDEYLNNALT